MKNSKIGKKFTDYEVFSQKVRIFMTEVEIRREIEADKLRAVEEPFLFSDEEMEEMIRWKPVSNISTDEIYKDLPEVKRFHDSYVTQWGLRNKKNER